MTRTNHAARDARRSERAQHEAMRGLVVSRAEERETREESRAARHAAELAIARDRAGMTCANHWSNMGEPVCYVCGIAL